MKVECEDINELRASIRSHLHTFFPNNDTYQLMFHAEQYRRLYGMLSEYSDTMRTQARDTYKANPKAKHAQEEKDVAFVFCAALDQFLRKELALLLEYKERPMTISLTVTQAP